MIKIDMKNKDGRLSISMIFELPNYDQILKQYECDKCKIRGNYNLVNHN